MADAKRTERLGLLVVKVLYIMGWSRSGSTLLDNVLGEVDGFFSTGELREIWDAGLDRGWLCGCGEPLPECSVWSEILERAFSDLTPNPVEDPKRVQRLQSETVRMRHVPRLLSGRPVHQNGSAALNEIIDLTGRLYRAVAKVTGASVVVDSSKRPQDAALLRLIPGIELYLVQLVRDPRAVARSMQRPISMQPTGEQPVPLGVSSPASSTAGWLRVNLAGEVVRARHGRDRTMVVRYEDFVDQPEQTIGGILDLLDEPRQGVRFRDERRLELHRNHTVWGNPRRFSTGVIELRLDDEWKRDLQPAARRTSTLLALPLLSRYGYPLRPGA